MAEPPARLSCRGRPRPWPAGASRGRGPRWSRRSGRGCLPYPGSPLEDLDPGDHREVPGVCVGPGEVKVIAAAVAGIAVVPDPAERRARLVLPRLGPSGQPRHALPVTVALRAPGAGADVDRHPVLVIGIGNMAAWATDDLLRIARQRPGVSLVDRDREMRREVAQIGDQPAVDHRPGLVGDRGRDRDDLARSADDLDPGRPSPRGGGRRQAGDQARTEDRGGDPGAALALLVAGRLRHQIRGFPRSPPATDRAIAGAT